jgi:hypothetical protein
MPVEDQPSSTLSIPSPQTDDELLDLLDYYLGVKLARHACCDGHTAPATAFCNAYFARYPWMVWKAARGVGGKSYMLAALAWMESVTLRASVSVLGGSGAQSKRVQDYVSMFWLKPHAPYDALKSDPTAIKTRMVWGNFIEAQTASQTSVRGAHPQRLRVDEADEVEWKLVDAARGQPMDKDGIASNIVFSSTHQNADGTMTRLMKEAAERGMPIYEWCWRENMAPAGWLTEQAKERYRASVTVELWRVEVELGEPSPEGRAIVPQCVEEMFSLPNEPLNILARKEFRDVEGQYFEFEEPLVGAAYATGADWGSKGDETVIWTWRCDVMPMRLVAAEHLSRRPMPWMIERLMARVRRYPGDAFHDATGVGTYHADQFTEVVDDYLMVGKKRDDLFTNYITAIERGECRAPRLISGYHAHKYVRNKDLYSAREAQESGTPAGHPPDAFVAGAMAYAAALSARHPLALAGGGQSASQAQPVPGSTAAQAAGSASPLRALTSFMARKPEAS